MYITDRFKVKRLEKLFRFRQNFAFDCSVSSVGRSTTSIGVHLGVSNSLGRENWVFSRPTDARRSSLWHLGAAQAPRIAAAPRQLLPLAGNPRARRWRRNTRGELGATFLGVSKEKRAPRGVTAFGFFRLFVFF